MLLRGIIRCESLFIVQYRTVEAHPAGGGDVCSRQRWLCGETDGNFWGKCRDQRLLIQSLLPVRFNVEHVGHMP